MNFKERLAEKKSAILKAWYDAALAIPAGRFPDFLEKQNALIADVMGYSLAEGLDGLFDALLRGVIPDDVSRFLDSMIRLRAVNDFKASQAVAFIAEVKKIVRKELGNEVLSDPFLREELTTWEAAVDDLVLFAFDIYVRYREKILEQQTNEAKNETLRLLKKAKLIPDDQE